MSESKKGLIEPQTVVAALDRHIVGQKAAKRAVAIALVSRERRACIVDEEMRREIMPNNILMVGPTGVGKTEIARRLAAFTQSPFLKVEVTKFTEVGYVGQDVEKIVRDLVEVAVAMHREAAYVRVKNMAENAALKKIVAALKAKKAMPEGFSKKSPKAQKALLQEAPLRDVLVELEVPSGIVGVEIMTPPGMEEMSQQLQDMFQSLGSEKVTQKRLKVAEAFRQLTDQESNRLVHEDEIIERAVEDVEQNGIVFLDEIDKIVSHAAHYHGEVSREGVQRDLLPLIEGCSVGTRYGSVRTDHILFIASGAFLGASPSDMISELQGRLPIRVTLDPLEVEDFIHILKDPKASLIRQAQALLKTQDVKLAFQKSGIERIAQIAYHLNETSVNIGARRLHTVMGRLLEDLSFHASRHAGKTIRIDAKYVDAQLEALMSQEEEWSHWVL